MVVFSCCCCWCWCYHHQTGVTKPLCFGAKTKDTTYLSPKPNMFLWSVGPPSILQALRLQDLFLLLFLILQSPPLTTSEFSVLFGFSTLFFIALENWRTFLRITMQVAKTILCRQGHCGLAGSMALYYMNGLMWMHIKFIF